MSFLRRKGRRRRVRAGETPAVPLSAAGERRSGRHHRPPERPRPADGWWSSAPILIDDAADPDAEPRPPADTTFLVPYRPDTIVDGWRHADVTVRAASTRGVGHRRSGAPRQDDVAVTPVPGTPYVVLAVADGVSAAPFAHVGSTTAVRYAGQWLMQRVAAGTDPHDIPWATLLDETTWRLLEEAGRKAGGDAPARSNEVAATVATTLAVAVVGAHPDGGLFGSGLVVGDSEMRILAADRSFQPLTVGRTPDDAGFVSSAVAPLPLVPSDAVIPVEIDVRPGEFLLIGSDGVWDPLGSGGGSLGRTIDEVLHRSTEFGDGYPTVTEFGHLVDFRKDSFDDDRTLVAAWGPPR